MTAEATELPQRIAALSTSDPQFQGAHPLPDVTAAINAEGLSVQQVVETAMLGYLDRPALGERVREIYVDDEGQQRVRPLAEFETITYRELWSRVGAIAAEWSGHSSAPLSAGGLVAILGFASTDYTLVDLACLYAGAVSVPLPAGAPAHQHLAIMEQTNPTILAVSVEYLADAVDTVLAGAALPRLLVIDYDPRDSGQRGVVTASIQRLADADSTTVVNTLADVLETGAALPPVPLHTPDLTIDPLVTLIYTSGSTGTPKGVIYTDRMVRTMWLRPAIDPVIGLTYMPMSHQYARGWVARILAHGGIAYFAASSDMSTLFEDFALVRPTTLNLVPRVCDLIYQQYLSEKDKRIANGDTPESVTPAAMSELREDMLGNRVLSAICGSAPLTPEMREFVESFLDVPVSVGYGSTEMMGVTHNTAITRPNVIDYKLIDVPELGYFSTDRPYPRGELLVKTTTMMPGYYRRPDATAEVFDADGYYRSGDIMALIGPDQLEYVDRRNNVIKLAQGEFVAITNLEAIYSASPLVHQIYVYGSSARAFLLAVVVPVAGLEGDDDSRRAQILASLHQLGKDNELNGYEIPREIILSSGPFTMQNNLLTGGGKLARPQLRARFGDDLEALYTRIAEDQAGEVRALRAQAASLPLDEAVRRAVSATLGIPATEVDSAAAFIDLGGDSLSALSLSRLLRDMLDVEVPAGVLTGATSNLAGVTAYIERRRSSATGPTFRSVHGTDETQVVAADLTLPKFIDAQTLRDAKSLPAPEGPIRTVLLTGATGFLGRFLALLWLRRLSEDGGTLVCIARGSDALEARKRLTAAFESDPGLLAEFSALAEDHLDVVAGDVGEPGLGIDAATWAQLAADVDLIVHPAAHVNHMLPYDQLFGANVAGTAELIRLAMTSKLKAINYISSMGVASGYIEPIGEHDDIRVINPVRELDAAYASAYSASKWASEVLTREANDWCGIPVTVFRPDMILAHRHYAGQLNVPDMFTRLMLSLVTTGLAPRSFYQESAEARPHYDGLPVDYIAEAVTTIGAATTTGHHTYNVVNPHDDGISLDQFVDWMILAGCPIERIADHAEWVARFETALKALPDRQRQNSVLMVLDAFRWPIGVTPGSEVPSDAFEAASNTQLGQDIPSLSQELAVKYLADLDHLSLI